MIIRGTTQIGADPASKAFIGANPAASSAASPGWEERVKPFAFLSLKQFVIKIIIMIIRIQAGVKTVAIYKKMKK